MITFFILLITALTTITILTIGGAIASRKFNFDFSIISFFSLTIYFVISILATNIIDATAGVTLVGLMGLFEATVAWKLVLKFEATFGEKGQEIKEMIEENYNPHPTIVSIVVLIYMFLGWLATLIA